MRTFWLSICVLLSLGVGNAQSMRERLLMNEDWRFAKGHAAIKKKILIMEERCLFLKLLLFRSLLC